MSDVEKPTEEVETKEPDKGQPAPPDAQAVPEVADESEAPPEPAAPEAAAEPAAKPDKAERRGRPTRRREEAESEPPPPHPLEAPLKERFGDKITGFDVVKGHCAAVVRPQDLEGLVRQLKEESGYNHLRCITGLDRGDRLEVAYNLMCLQTREELVLKVKLDRESPKVPSLCSLWKTADWLERETYDLLGIEFEGHPDLRRILLPDDWEGHPLRKDYDYR